MTTICVTGDWVADLNLAQTAEPSEGYFDGSLQTQLHHRAGGAWYVAHLIEQVACRDLVRPSTPLASVVAVRDPADASPILKQDGTPREDVAHAHSIWWKHRRTNAAKKDDEVWRVGRFTGCRKSSAWSPPVLPDGESSADLVVVDDLGLGFASHGEAVRHVVSYAGTDADVVLKHGIGADGSQLLPQLLEQGFGDRLHVVTAASALRRRNAALTRALSWDRALEDIEAEFASGHSVRDLSRCATAVVSWGLAGAAVFRRGKLHRFYFLPDELEGTWEDDRPGGHFGTGSAIAACLARHLVDPDGYPLFFAVTQALAAQRKAHHEGAGKGDELEVDLAFGPRGTDVDPQKHPAAGCIGPPTAGDAKDAKHLEGIQAFRAAWSPQDFPMLASPSAQGLRRSRLLCNAAGTTSGALHSKAVEVVIQGGRKALASVPKASYGKYVTADRDEIESINEIRRLILEYQRNREDRRPLSIAVFGAPGSGKSFAIKQVAKAIFGKDKEPLEFNLTQFRSAEDLHRAFHQVRDASVKLELPLVFWDEFDAVNLRWLADFLAPMQDAEFFDGSLRHPFGKCVFVFAGGTCASFDEFKRWAVLEKGEAWEPVPHDPWHSSFKAVKGPDFISRLRGFVNVKGPNPALPCANATRDDCIAHDPAFVLRRAIVLRSEIERVYPQLLHPKTGRATIAANVVHALLSVERYEHGARSISALLGMSALAGVKSFEVSALPSDDLIRLHVSVDFRSRLADPAWTEELLLALAKAGHEGYCIERLKTEPNAPDAKPWETLDEDARRRNLDPVPRRLLELQRLGVRTIPKTSRATCQVLTARDIARLTQGMVEPEHHIWLSNALCQGFERAAKTSRWLRLNSDIADFARIARGNQLINLAISRETLRAFEPAGFCLVCEAPTSIKKTTRRPSSKRRPSSRLASSRPPARQRP